MGLHTDVEGAERRTGRARNLHGQAGSHRRQVGGQDGQEVGIGSRARGVRSRHSDEEAYDDDSHRGHEMGSREEEGHDARSSHPKGKDDGQVEETGNDRSVRYAGSHLEAAAVVSLQDREDPGWRVRTSEVQRTLTPLKSLLSSFSTATFRSAAVSNSTNLMEPNQ